MDILIAMTVWTLIVFMSLFAMLRMTWIDVSRLELLVECPWKYTLLPSFDRMMLRFWVWDINKFI